MSIILWLGSRAARLGLRAVFAHRAFASADISRRRASAVLPLHRAFAERRCISRAVISVAVLAEIRERGFRGVTEVGDLLPRRAKFRPVISAVCVADEHLIGRPREVSLDRYHCRSFFGFIFTHIFFERLGYWPHSLWHQYTVCVALRKIFLHLFSHSKTIYRLMPDLYALSC